MHESIGQTRRRQKKQKKKSILWLALVATMTIAVTGTFAYMSIVSTPILNTISFNTVSVGIEEPGIDPDRVPWGEASKPVKLRNTGGVNSVVRVLFVPVLETNGTVKPCEFAAMSEPVGNVMTLGDAILHFSNDWANHWFYKNGMFYYKSVLPPGESTTQLLAGVTLTDWSTSIKYAKLQIKVLADALQAEGGAAQDAWGIQVDAAAGTVTP